MPYGTDIELGGSRGQFLHTSPTTPAPSLISIICQPKNRAIKKPCILWGRNHESDVLETYKLALGIGQPKQGTSTQMYLQDQVGTSHVNLQVKRAGFRVSLDKQFIEASCDGYVMCDCCGAGVVEAKCPYKQSRGQMTPAQCNWCDKHISQDS